MPDRVVNPAAGPHGMFATDRPPSRGQHHTIATLAAQLLDEDPPTCRNEATILIARLRNALDRKAGVR